MLAWLRQEPQGVLSKHGMAQHGWHTYGTYGLDTQQMKSTGRGWAGELLAGRR